MLVTVFNKNGYKVETLESVLVPFHVEKGVFYLLYEFMNTSVITKVERKPPHKEREYVVAVRHGDMIEVYDDLPDKLMEELEFNVSKKDRVSIK